MSARNSFIVSTGSVAVSKNGTTFSPKRDLPYLIFFESKTVVSVDGNFIPNQMLANESNYEHVDLDIYHRGSISLRDTDHVAVPLNYKIVYLKEGSR